jgi:hypothetical protein
MELVEIDINNVARAIKEHVFHAEQVVLLSLVWYLSLL